MPYFCHVGSHLYITDKEQSDGCAHPACISFSKVDVPPVGIMVGTVPGGHNDTHSTEQYKFQAGFDKGLDAYKKARGEGLRPKASTVDAVGKAQREVKSHQRALKKLGMKRSDLNMPVAAGVE